jgi:hypothetical protein
MMSIPVAHVRFPPAAARRGIKSGAVLSAAQTALIGASDDNFIHHDLTDIVFTAYPYDKSAAPALFPLMNEERPSKLGPDWDFVTYGDLVGNVEGAPPDARRVLMAVAFTYSSNSFHVEQVQRVATKALGALTDGFLTKVLGATFALQVRTLVKNKKTEAYATVMLDGSISGKIYTLAVSGQHQLK